MRSITRLIELRESDDQQIAIVASKALWEISWGKPREFDPKADDGENAKDTFDPRAYTPEEVRQIEEALLLVVDPARVRAERDKAAVEALPPPRDGGGSDAG